MTSVDNVVREMFEDAMNDASGYVSEEHWAHLKETLCSILDFAADFYECFEYGHYEHALDVACNVLDGSSPEDVIQAMAGTAYRLLNPLVEEEVKEFSAETRARLERIRDTHPDFAAEEVAS